MRTYVLNLWDAARASYWFVPSLFASGALLLSLLMPLADATLFESDRPLPEWVRTTTQAARATLSAVAGAVVAVTGTVFSITIVTLSLTSQQFGPRLLRRFMYDLPTQVTLGVFLSTGIYCLLVLRAVEHHDGEFVAPHLSVLTAVVLAVLSMALLIVFIHHVAMLIQAPHIVAAVARDLDDSIVRLFPEKIGDSAEDELESSAAIASACAASPQDDGTAVRSRSEGYIQAINGDGLMHLACERDLVLHLRRRPGDFIEVGSRLADVWFATAQGLEETNADDLEASLDEAFIVGLRRTPRQDVQCAVSELVEVAVRSLSPGINDPFTAMNCIDRLGAALGRLAERKLPAADRYDTDGCLRVIAEPVTFTEVLNAAFNPIRQNCRNSVAVANRLLEALASVATHIHREEDRISLIRQAELISRHAEALPEKYDQQELASRFEKVTSTLNQMRIRADDGAAV